MREIWKTKKRKKLYANFMIATILLNLLFCNMQIVYAEENNLFEQQYICKADEYSVSINITAEWEQGYNAEIIITNLMDKNMQDWQAQLVCGDFIVNIWNGILEKDEQGYVIFGTEYNSSIPARGSIVIGYTAEGNRKDLMINSLCCQIEQKPEVIVGDPELNSNKMPESIILYQEGYQVELIISEIWDEAYNVKGIITNTSSDIIHNWGIALNTSDIIKNVYNAQVINSDENICLFKNRGWNQDIPVGGNVVFGYTAFYTQQPDFPNECFLATCVNVLQNTMYQVSYLISNEWENGAIAQIVIENCGDYAIEDWVLSFDTELQITDIWDGHIKSVDGNNYIIQNPDYAQNIVPGEFAVIGMRLEGTTVNGVLDNVIMEEVIISDEYMPAGNISGNTSGNDQEMLDEWIYINEADFIKLENEPVTYFLDNLVDKIRGTLVCHDDIISMNYVLADISGNRISEGEICPMEQWEIEDIAFVIGVNELKFEILDINGNIYQKKFYFINFSKENMNRTNMDQNDDDGDGICNYFEQMLGLDKNSFDSDGDGLSDWEEIVFSLTDPLLFDTNNNGIDDGEEDIDGDGISAIQELRYGTNILSMDSDRDGINDWDEINVYGTDPVNEDTDGDKLLDGEDVLLGFSPLLADTNGNGIIDSEEVVYQEIGKAFEDEENAIKEVRISMSTKGNMSSDIIIQNMDEVDDLSSDVIGKIGVPVDITVLRDFETANISFVYDDNLLGDTKEEDLCLMWYDEVAGVYQLLEDCVVDINNNTVSYTTTHFSTYLLVDKQIWYDAWREEINYNSYSYVDQESLVNYDVVVMFDYSVTPVELQQEKALLQQIINGMTNGDRIRIGFYTETGSFAATAWYTNSSSASALLNNLEYYYYMAYGKNIQATGTHRGRLDFGVCSLQVMQGDRTYNDNQSLGFIIHAGTTYNEATSLSSSFTQGYLQKMDALGMKVNAVSVTNQVNLHLETLVKNHGGTYFNMVTNAGADEILENYIREKHSQSISVNEFSTIDTDGDGLYDIYEINGMRMANGRIIYTDPFLADTDGDGISDYDEVGGLPALYNMIMGTEMFGRILIHPISNPLDANEAGRQLNENYIFVDDLDYLPYNEENYGIIYRDGTHEVDCYGQEVMGRRNIWHSNPDELTEIEKNGIINRLTLQVFLAEEKFPYAATFLYQYLFNVEDIRMFNATEILAESSKILNIGSDGDNFANYTNKDHMLLDVFQIARAGVDYLQPGEKIIIALSPEAKGSGLYFGGYAANFVDNGQLSLAINYADTATVAEISFDGVSYHMKLRYYIFDYYDWDKTDTMPVGLISPEDMYRLCQTGWAKFYENWGVYTTEIDWEASERTDGEEGENYLARTSNEAAIIFNNQMKILASMPSGWKNELDYIFYYKYY